MAVGRRLPTEPAEYAPRSIHAVFDRLVTLRPKAGFQLGGILGDATHTYGYHRARAVLPPDDYSVELARDQSGPSWAASALDITPASSEHLQHLTRRMAAAIRNSDPRVTSCVREVAGTVNGVSVWAWDLARRSPTQFDQSHLWHMHISFYRDTTNRPGLLLAVADVLAGNQ